MSLQTNSSNLWICRLGYQDMADWSRGLLDLKARALGVKGWIAPIAVDKQGDFIEPLESPKQRTTRRTLSRPPISAQPKPGNQACISIKGMVG